MTAAAIAAPRAEHLIVSLCLSKSKLFIRIEEAVCELEDADELDAAGVA